MLNVRNKISRKLSTPYRAVLLTAVTMLKQSPSTACHRKSNGLKSGSESLGF